MFGGFNACLPFLNDVWLLSDANGLGTPAWTQLSPAGTPPIPRLFHSAVYDAANNRMIVFGGEANTGPTGALNDVWVLSHPNGLGGTPTWTLLTPTGGPPSPRFAHNAIYDPATNSMTVFGGIDITFAVFFNDVWVLSNANGLGGPPTWTQLTPTGGPPSPRAGQSAIYNPPTNRMTIFGGAACVFCGSPILDDTWVLTDANGIVTVPFAAFDAKAEIALRPRANDDAFEVKATFTLGPGSDGIAPLTEVVSLQVGSFSTTIPAGSFKVDKKGDSNSKGSSPA